MINVAPWRQKYPSWVDVSAATSSLVLANCSARLPLADFRPYNELYSPKTLFNVLTSASLTTFLPVFNEYNALLARGGDPDDFDWVGHMEPHKEAFLPNLAKFSSIQVTKKLFQYYCVNSFDAVVADRLTKDMTRSAYRKFYRYGRSLTFVSETFAMVLGAEAIGRSAILTVDSALELRKWLQSKKREYNLLAAGQWVVKKSLRMLIGSSMSALGFAIGSLFDQKFMLLGGLLAMVAEFAITPVCDALIGI